MRLALAKGLPSKMSRARLDNLPTELLQQINSYLDNIPSARLALKVVNRQIYHQLPTLAISKWHSLSWCERNLIHHYLHPDPSWRFCRIHKYYVVPAMFDVTRPEREDAEAAWILDHGFGKNGTAGMIDGPEGGCHEHKSELVMDIAAGLGRQPRLRTLAPQACEPGIVDTASEAIAETGVAGLTMATRWISIPAKMCMHCGQLKGQTSSWSPFKKLHTVGICDCVLGGGCECCGERDVRIYLRVIKDWLSRDESRGYVLFKNRGRIMVREWFVEGRQPAWIKDVPKEGKERRMRLSEMCVGVDFEVTKLG